MKSSHNIQPSEGSVNTTCAATARNARVAARWDELHAAGKHGHYETLFQIVREEVERAQFGTWQPIETAPHDVRILLYVPELKAIKEVPCVRTGLRKRWSIATHWMPLPEPPE